MTLGLAVGIPVVMGLASIPAFFLLRRYLQGPTSGSDTDTRLDEKVAVVTGANTGIGKETARELYLRGARVLALCRNRRRAEEAISDIVDGRRERDGKAGGPLGTIEYVKCDLSSLSSIRECAEEVNKRVNKIDILINNAGLYGKGTDKTEDGFNLTFGVNHIGTFLLTELLIPLVLAAAGTHDSSGGGYECHDDALSRPKIINLSSIAHNAFPLQLDKMNFDGPMTDMEAWRAYSNSKLANILHAKELSDRYHPPINTYAVHPGVVATEVFRDVKWYIRIFIICFKPLFKTPFHGAQTTLYCALHPQAQHQSGLYYDNCAVKEPHPRANDKETQKRLWNFSIKAANLDP